MNDWSFEELMLSNGFIAFCISRTYFDVENNKKEKRQKKTS